MDSLCNYFNNDVVLNENQINNIDSNFKVLKNLMEKNLSDIQLKQKDLSEMKFKMKSKMSEIDEILNILTSYEK
jgi:hypothetical protein